MLRRTLACARVIFDGGAEVGGAGGERAAVGGEWACGVWRRRWRRGSVSGGGIAAPGEKQQF